jgi:single-strand DNA-binding protein
MTAHISAYGRLGFEPKHIQTKTGKKMAATSLAVDSGTEEAIFFNVICFGRVAEELLRLDKGNPVSVIGRLQLNCRERDGEKRSQLQIVADQLVTARTVRPGGRRKIPGEIDGQNMQVVAGE